MLLSLLVAALTPAVTAAVPNDRGLVDCVARLSVHYPGAAYAHAEGLLMLHDGEAGEKVLFDTAGRSARLPARPAPGTTPAYRLAESPLHITLIGPALEDFRAQRRPSDAPVLPMAPIGDAERALLLRAATMLLDEVDRHERALLKDDDDTLPADRRHTPQMLREARRHRDSLRKPVQACRRVEHPAVSEKAVRTLSTQLPEASPPR